ncbi:hypothetical protein A2856_03225 [Candidatus Uhrbacteria bacterium RIFCSPHIGHO2_01_FULL_63_20]|uniref:Uncharacterized protein n=1 Tax=Candidatus Uhrbacteria bacterium RIFCSPHIGHO2_01_FULL_63_20 TaxID=1802385 RepID=A0A1F7TLA2_9BACT|nr:MAG: hypothetical protein A2856_03225 [Candidatus Uhrbacteria bacterium RIFCSPHIGHO2_01_FULL_63_20]
MHETCDDPIDVVVSFTDGRVTPRRLRWRGREYAVERVNLIHATNEGERRVFYFSVSDRNHDFKLRLDTEALQWKMVELYADG